MPLCFEFCDAILVNVILEGNDSVNVLRCFFQVSLHDHNAKHAHFRIMPRYKVKAEGDIVSLKYNIEYFIMFFELSNLAFTVNIWEMSPNLCVVFVLLFVLMCW